MPIKICFSPKEAILLSDIINERTLRYSGTPKVDILRGATLCGVELGIFMSEEEKEHMNKMLESLKPEK